MSVSVEVWGDFACFSCPEMKTERVSYEVITPSAARGLLEAIYWHPGLKRVIDRIQVCEPIKFTNIKRNGVKDVIPWNAVKKSMESGNENLYLVTSDSIQQRNAMVLRNVHYIIDAHFEMTDSASPSDNPAKFQEMTLRRIEKGQCYHQPYLGVREFPAHFQMCKKRPSCPKELLGERDLGWMLLDMDYSNPADIRPKFFRAIMRDGVIDVPDFNSSEVMG